MSNLAILQASTQSLRFPNKVLQKVGGQPMVLLAASRILQCPLLDKLVVSVPLEPADAGLADLLQRAGLSVQRMVWKSETYNLAPFMEDMDGDDRIVRVTADCPFVDPALMSLVLEATSAGVADVVATRTDRWFYATAYPPGYDVECFSVRALRTHGGDMTAVWTEGKGHILNADPACQPGLSVTVDYAHDLLWVRTIWDYLNGNVAYQTVRDMWSRWS